MDAASSDLLMVIVDVGPAWLASEPAEGDSSEALRFPDAVAAIQLFLSAFAALTRHSNLVVLAYNGAVGGAVWPPASAPAVGTASHLRPAEVMAGVGAALLDVARRDKEAAAAMVRRAGDDRLSSRFATLAACMSKAVCHYAAVVKRQPRLRARLLVLKRGADLPGEYIAFVNATYSLQRFRVPVDSVQFGVAAPDTAATVALGAAAAAGGAGVGIGAGGGSVPPGFVARSVFLQQAAHLTDGVHGAPNQEECSALFQYLVTLFLPDPDTRGLLLYPPRAEVDLRASCFCHHRHVSLAWVCPVCLSVWCDMFDRCLMCGSTASTAPAPAAPRMVAAAVGGVGAAGGIAIAASAGGAPATGGAVAASGGAGGPP